MKFSKAWTEGPGVRRGGSDSLEGPGEGRGQWVFILGASSELRVQLICLGGVGGGPAALGRAAGRAPSSSLSLSPETARLKSQR